MQEVIPDAALVPALQKLADQNITYRLFTNNVTPDQATVLGDLTEAAWTGYAPITVIGSEWTPNDPVGGVGLLLHPPIAHVNSSGSNQSAYGYYRLDENGDLMAACRFDAAPVTKANGESWTIIPILGDKYEEL